MDKINVNILSENLKKLINPSTPSGLKVLAIKGTVPLKPTEYIIFLYLMLSDSDDDVRELASKIFSELPQKILSAVISQPLPQEVLHKIAIVYRSNPEVLEKIVINNATSDETFEMIASYADERLINIISRNQVRILRYPKIVKAIYENPNATASQKNMVLEFVQKSGVKLESIGISLGYKEEVKEEKLEGEIQEDDVETLGDTALEAEGETDNSLPEIEKKEIPSQSTSNKDELIKKFNIPREFYDENIPLPEEMEKKLIDDLEKMSEEMQMALVEVGRHRVKQIMAKSPIGSVALAAVKHPDITKDDIFKIAQDRTANAEAIKYIATHRDYIRVYNIKLKLALNPKTPVPMAMAFVRSLRLSDLKNIAKNASVSKILQNTAKGIIKMHS